MNQKLSSISVDEPWEFKGDKGVNTIKGTIIKILSPTCLIFKSESVLSFDGYTGQIMILSPRYANTNFYSKNHKKIINGGLLQKEFVFDDSVNEQTLKNEAKFVIIGSIRY